MIEHKIVITQRAMADISECVLFVSNVSKNAAKDLYREIIEKINSLKTFPSKYPEIDGLLLGLIKIRKMPVHDGRYIVLYKIDNNEVTIYDIIDSRKDNSILKL